VRKLDLMKKGLDGRGERRKVKGERIEKERGR
jgi:hypothetical protein